MNTRYCQMSCLQYHQLTGTHKGIWTDVSKLLVASEEPKREKLNMKDDFFSFRTSVCDCASVCDSQSVHLCSIESVTCHLLDAISGEPSVIRKRSQVTVMWLQHRSFPTVNLSELLTSNFVFALLLFPATNSVQT